MFDKYEGMTEESRYKNAVVTNLEKIVKLLEGNKAIEEATITVLEEEKPKKKRAKKE